MKKIIALLIIVLFITICVSCVSRISNDTSTNIISLKNTELQKQNEMTTLVAETTIPKNQDLTTETILYFTSVLASETTNETAVEEITNESTTISTIIQTETSETFQTYKLLLLGITSPISAGNNATISVRGKPNTGYDIKVYYSSGASTAKGLEQQYSDKDGKVSWTWKIGAKTKAGTYRIEISGGGEKLTAYITVL